MEWEGGRRSGRILDRRGLLGWRGRMETLAGLRELDRAMAANRRSQARAHYWNQTDPSVRGMAGDKVFHHTPRVGDTVGGTSRAQPMSRSRQGLRPGRTSTMGRR
jgi:hypothetical protein